MRVAVLLYLYDKRLLSEYISLLKPLGNSIFLYVAISKDHINDYDYIQNELNTSYEYEYKISIHENKGMDIGPFLQQLEDLNEIEYPLFIKLHGKKSLWGIYKNIAWRILLVNSLIGSPEIFSRNLQLFNNPSVGMIGNTGLSLTREKEGFNSNLIKNVCNNFLSISTAEMNRNDLCFIGGTIFWSRTGIFKKYFNAAVIDHIYSKLEEKQFDDYSQGTYTHSLERIFGYIIGLSGYYIADGVVDNKITISTSHNTYKLVLCYNNMCYVEDNILVSGVYYMLNNQLIINWQHKSYNGLWKKYQKITDSLYSD
jgi:lipopolysaccharide biosynthesis protein